MNTRRVALVLLLSSAFAAMAFSAPIPQAPSSRLLLSTGWQIESGCKVPDKGDVISTSSYKPAGWIPTTVPNTVVAALVGAKGDKVYDDPYFGKNLLDVPGMDYGRGKVFTRFAMPDDSPFKCAWWYRTQFNVPATYKGQQLWLNFGGINYRANIWLNGKQIANSNDVAGAYRTYEFNITSGAKVGAANVLAVEITAPTPDDLGINWVDWNPAPPDKNMGLWREVYLATSGPVVVRHPQVISKVDAQTLDSADLTVTTEVLNTTANPVKGTLTGQIGNIKFDQPIELGANEKKLVTFSPEQFAQLKMSKPQLWWPWQMGGQPLQTLNVAFAMNEKQSDTQSVRFGIREVTSELTDKGGRMFRINGKPILIRGGGWAPDMLLREDQARTRKEFAYVKHMGLNTIRLEGKMETDYFYDVADQMGILIMPGWCCCDVWEQWQKWTPETHKIAQESLRSQIYRMRNHPSIYVWLNGSDNPPTPDVEKEYLAVEKELNWPNPIVSSATAKPTEVTGQSGVKMSGPYDWVPPDYWYADKKAAKYGGGWGYNTETSPGPAIPTVESLKKFIPADQLWPVSDTWLYHAGGGKFTQIDLFTDAMNQRYGAATDLSDFERKAQAIAYEGQRAMFEAYTRDKYTSTGVIQWMLNNAWPSIIWHLYDYYLDPGAGYFATRKANEPLHVLYGYDDGGVYVINSTYAPVKGLKAKATVLNFDLTPKFTKEAAVDLAPDGTVQAFALPAVADMTGLSTTYFVKLELTDATGKRVSDNFYWLSTKPDQYDWAKSTFYNTPVTQHADVTMLNTLPKVELVVSQRRTTGAVHAGRMTGVRQTDPGSDSQTTLVMVKNPSKALAFMVHLTLLKGTAAGTRKNQATNPGNATSLNPIAAGGDDVLPILWDDNYFTLLPGEERQVSATYSAADVGGAKPVIAVDGWNVVPK